MTFKLRKIVHYSLILCILLIQVVIAGFFYNEFINKKNLSFIEKRLQEVNSMEDLTDNSQKELINAQDYLHKYVTIRDNKYLDQYFESLNKLEKNLDSISTYKSRYPRLKDVLISQKGDSVEIRKLKVLIDSTQDFSVKVNLKPQNDFSKIKKYDFTKSLDKFNFDVETKTYSDTVKKKGFFGRLGDAIKGKENVRTESTVITVNKGKTPDIETIKKELDSIMNTADTHYSKEIQKIQIRVIEKQKGNDRFYKMSSNLLVYSNRLMGIYEGAVKSSKSDLEKEYAKQNSENDKMNRYLIFGSMILMFIVSVLIMYFTRIAFLYEQKLNSANKKIKENLNFKNRILGMLSHELRSPLKIIGIFVNRIYKKMNDESIKDYLRSISYTNNTLLMQANQILEYTKNQQVENKLIPVVFGLKNEIQSILHSIEPYIETRNNKFIVNENIDPDIVVYSDNTKINQIFMNILGNANKFTENGEIIVTVTTKFISDDVISLTTEVSDTGVGISKKDLEKIFEPYYQGVLSEDIENLGAGLGLSLCKEIIALYSGDISVESEENKGTNVVFTVNLSISK